MTDIILVASGRRWKLTPRSEAPPKAVAAAPQPPPKPPHMSCVEDIYRAAAAFYGFTFREFVAVRDHDMARRRQLAIALANEMFPKLRCARLGLPLRRSRSTVLHSLRAVQTRFVAESGARLEYDALRTRVLKGEAKKAS